MAKWKDKNNALTEIDKAVSKAVKNVLPTIMELLKANVKSNRKADGTPQPKKKASTKAQYKKHGWDTENWLVRTGKSTKLKKRKQGNGWVVEPTDKTILKYHLDEVEDWMLLTDDDKEIVFDEISKELKKIF